MEKMQNGSEEHETFEMNSIFMFNMLTYKTLDWPSLTCQWLPDKEEDSNGETFYKLLLGTHADDEENKLKVLKVKFVNTSESSEDGFLMKAETEILKECHHSGDVNRARYLPQNPGIIGTRSSNGDCYVYGREGRLMTLKGHSDEGYGMTWNIHEEGKLATAGFDCKINIWNVNHTMCSDEVRPFKCLEGHGDKVEDVQWHPRDSWQLASAGDDKKIILWDIRSDASVVMKWEAHGDEVNCVDWHPVTYNLILSGGSDGSVELWDIRNVARPLHSFYHGSPVYRVVWASQSSTENASIASDGGSSNSDTVFVSTGLNSRAVVWDLDKIGDDVMSCEAEEGALGGVPERVFEHMGHESPLSDVSWHPHSPWTLATVSEDNELCVWKINSSIFQDDLM